jgi:hypothetical protein
MEAVNRWNWRDLNPFLTTLGFGFFNDHWHPALLIAKPLSFMFSTSTSLFITELTFYLLAAALPLYFAIRGYVSSSSALLISIFLLLDKSVLEALVALPIHPAVWAHLPLLMGSFLLTVDKSESPKISIAAAFMIWSSNFFGEQFSLSALGLSAAWIILEPRRKSGYFFCAVALITCWFTLSGRELIFGPLLHQTERVAFSFSGLLSKYNWDSQQLLSLGSYFISISPLLYLMASSKDFKNKFRATFIVTSIFGPLILGRLLSNSFGHQYSALLTCAVAAFAFVFLKDRVISKKALISCSVLFALFSASKLERIYNVLVSNNFYNCVDKSKSDLQKQARVRDLTEAVEFIQIDSKDSALTVLALGNLVPNLVESVDSNSEIWTLAPGLSETSDPVDWIITERGTCGDPWPWTKEKLNEKSIELQNDSRFRVVRSSDCLLLLKASVNPQ